MQTREPSSRKRAAVAAPIPLAPPVMRIRLSRKPRITFCVLSSTVCILLEKTEGPRMKHEHFFKVREKIGQAVIAKIRMVLVFHSFFLQLVV